MPVDNPLKGGTKATWTIALIAGGGVALYFWWKKRQQAQTAATTTAQAGYGYGYGSPAGYGYGVSPIYGYGQGGPFGWPFAGGYGGYGYQGTPTPTTNSQWFQQALAFLTQNGTSTATAEAALAKYIAGQPVDATQTLIIQEAEAAIGPPPQAGPNGFPPNINTSTSGGGGNAQNPVTGLKVSKPGTTGVDVSWNASSGATSYQVRSSKGNVGMTGATSARIHSINAPGHPSSATVSVLAEPAATTARAATITVHTNR
jgi:hypothetical protein